MPRERDIDFRIRAETSGFLRPIRDAQTATESLERGIRELGQAQQRAASAATTQAQQRQTQA